MASSLDMNEPTLASLLGLPDDDDDPAEPPQTLCGRPLPPWTQILAEAGIAESPGYRETCELMRGRRLRD
jgi:hypothetical protein